MAVTFRNDHQKQFVDEFKRLIGKYSSWQIWEDFVVMTACAISNRVDQRNYEKREALYMSRVKRYDPKDAQVFPKLFSIVVDALDTNPEQDFLGELFMQLELGSYWKGQFFTPYSLCRAMAELQFTGFPDKPYISVNDPACGAGATLIGFANVIKSKGYNYQERILFAAQDIDQTAALMCYIQLSLLGCAGYVVIQDTLSKPTITADSDVWYTPIYFSGVWHWRRTYNRLNEIIKSTPKPVPEESMMTTTEVKTERPFQLTLF